MVYIRNRTWQMAVLLEKLSGYWPYQSKVKNYSIMISAIILILVFVFGLATSLIKHWNNNFAIAIENFNELIPCILLITKIVTIFVVEKKRRQIFERVSVHFETVVEEDEVQILCDFANKGLTLTTVSTVSISAGVGSFVVLPYIRMYLSYFFGDGELRKILPFPVDFLIDEDKYFYCIVLDGLIAITACSITQLSFDLSYFMIVRHACALFEIVKLRIARASKIFEQCGQIKKLSDLDEKMAYKILSSAVDLHNDAFELTQLIDETYNGCMFIVLLLNAVVIVPFPASMMQHVHEPFELFRRGLVFFVFPVHFYVTFLQGQLIIDYSSSVFDACYDFHWYNTSKRCRTVIEIMMSRSLIPSRLTGGNMFHLSMETYSVVLKTAISYISMFAAFME